jgi:ribosomal protein L37AE/L43A
MAERVIEAEVVEERIVACPQCRRTNRLHKRSTTGVYRCGACRAALANPFAARPARMPTMRVMGIIAALVLTLLVIIAVVAGITSSPRSPAQQEEIRKAAERDARVDKLISENGPAALPAIPKPSYYASTPVTIARSPIAPTSASAASARVQPPAAPPADLPTIVPTNNEILFDAYPGSKFRGQLTIDNGTSSHAVAKLIDRQTRQKILSFTISARSKANIYAIPDGSYDLLFAFGDQLYVGSDRFKNAHGFAKFADSMEFTTNVTEDAIVWSNNSVTLHKLISGNARTESISREEFERY